MENVKQGLRVKFGSGRQRGFIEQSLIALDTKIPELAKMCNVCERTLRDWKREKYNISFGSLKTICDKKGMVIPKDIGLLSEYWSTKKASKLGGKRYVELYGPPGTEAGRSKGGRVTQEIFRSNPGLRKEIALKSRKKIKYPKKSAALAEFIGIMLGDGGMGNGYQFKISFNRKADVEYADYIQRLIRRLFGVSSTVKIREKYGSGDIIVSGRNLVEFLIGCGIKEGNKVTGRIDIPQWIKSSKKYKIACLRGLIDTDGCFYSHSYIVNGKNYKYLKMCFTSYSAPLLKSVTAILEDIGLRPKNTAKNRVYLYSLDQLNKYFKKVGSSNPRYSNIYNNFCKSL
ncbi:MAG: LAGLIDADG family homing endonuclease [Candidatus Omnitrophota bacterium]